VFYLAHGRADFRARDGLGFAVTRWRAIDLWKCNSGFRHHDDSVFWNPEGRSQRKL